MIDATLLPVAETNTGAPEPITVAQAKDHLRVIGADEDEYIAGLIMAARMMLEGRINRTIVPRTLEMKLHRFDPYGIALPAVPFLDGLEISYTDSNGEAAALTEFYLDHGHEPVVIYPANGQLFPLVTAGPGAVTIKYRAGYPDPASVPASLKQWMLLAVGTMYQHRETTVVGVSIADVSPDFMRMLWQPFMVYV